jgi:hypothetical protein
VGVAAIIAMDKPRIAQVESPTTLALILLFKRCIEETLKFDHFVAG